VVASVTTVGASRDHGQDLATVRINRLAVQGGMVAGFYWDRHPDGPFATLIMVVATTSRGCC
jgi:hypothetical protein